MFKSYTKKNKEYLFTTLKDRNFVQYLCLNVDRAARYYYKKYYNNPSKVISYYHQGLKILQLSRQQAAQWSRRLAVKNKRKQLIEATKFFNNLNNKIQDFYSTGPFFVIETWQKDLAATVDRLIIKNNLEKNRDAIINTLYRPWRKTAWQKIRADYPKYNIEKLIDKYQFLRSFAVIWHHPIGVKWFGALKDVRRSRRKLYTRQQIINILKPNRTEKYFLKMAPYMVFYKDWRDEMRRKIVYDWHFLFTSISRHFRIPYDDIGYLSAEEIIECLKKDQIDKNKIKSRKEKGCLVTFGRLGKLKIVNYPFPLKYQTIVKQAEKIDNKKVSGTVAQTGYFRGRIMIVKNYNDIKNFPTGRILVANTTHPNYLPAMKKAAAFVTDEGGIICHAAIVAREMKKPCIVGTKIATNVLKNGDKVEVDANKGIVKKI